MAKLPKFFTRSVKLNLTFLIISTGLIVYGTLLPSDYQVSGSFPYLDKFVHFIMFGTWTFFYGLVRFLTGKFTLLPVFIWGGLFGLAIELMQHLLPIDRSPELLDFVADISGTGAAIVLLYVLAKSVPEFKVNASQ